MESQTVYFTGMMVFTLISQMYHRRSLLGPVFIRVLVHEYEYEYKYYFFGTYEYEKVPVPEIWDPGTASTSTPALPMWHGLVI